jgi:hypothetical protein
MDDQPGIALVEWVDSQSEPGWQSEPAALRHVSGEWGRPCYSVGFILADDESGVALALSRTPPQPQQLDTNALVSDVLQIPRSAVTKVTRLTVPKSARR